MSEAATQEQTPPQGGSILTSGLPPPAAPADKSAPQNGIEAAKQAAQRPEWAPEKYWKADKNEIDAEGLAKGYVNLEKLLGRDKVPAPLNDEDAEGWDRWYKASGRPEKPDEYDFKRPDKLPEGISYDDDAEKNFRQWAHANGLNKRQATNLYEGYVKHQVERHGAFHVSQVQARQEVENSLKREHGAQYEGFLTGARTAITQYADPEFRQYLEQTGLGNDPRMIRIFGRIGKEMGGETKLSGKPAPAASTQDMMRTISEFNGKYKESLFDRGHPDHAMRVKERSALYEAAFGE